MSTAEATVCPQSSESINQWLTSYIANALDVAPTELDPDTPLHQFGLDSSAVVGLVAELGDWLGQPLSITVVRKHNSISALSNYITTQD